MHPDSLPSAGHSFPSFFSLRVRRIVPLLLGLWLSGAVLLALSIPAFPSTDLAPPVKASDFHTSSADMVEIQDEAIVSVSGSGPSREAHQGSEELNGLSYQRPVFADIYFDERRTVIQGSLQHLLEDMVTVLERESTWGLRIEGHCDSRGTSAYNLAWAEHHLTTFSQYVEFMGIPAHRINRVNFGQDPLLCGHVSERCQEDNLRAQRIFSVLAIRQSQRGCLVRLRFDAGHEWDRAVGYSKELPYVQRLQVATPAVGSSPF